MNVTEQVRVIGRWMGHLLALAVLFAFLASCAGEEEVALETPPPTTAEDEAAPAEDEAATAAARIVEEGRAMFDATATAEAGERKKRLAELEATAEAEVLAQLESQLESELGYLTEAGLLNDEVMEILGEYQDWMDDVWIQYELGMLFPDTAAGELALDRMKDVVGRVESLNVPPAFQESHGLMLAGLSELVTGMGLHVAGAQQADPDLVVQGTAHVEEATRLMGLASDALERAE